MNRPGAMTAEQIGPVTLWAPGRAASPLILASPHSGRLYPPEFLAQSRLSPLQLRRAEDAYVDLLFQDGPRHGVPLLCANFPRVWLDVNRGEWELDPLMFAGPLPNTVEPGSARVAVGLGAIPRLAAQGEPIYGRKLPLHDIAMRQEQGWRPYHRSLTDLIEQTRQRFGCCVLLDCHSMPRIASGRGTPQPDFVIGDLFGASCRPDLVQFCESRLESWGFAVRRNTPYAGGYVTRHYGRPAEGVHVIQLEVARRLYLNEAEVELHEGFTPLRQTCEALAQALAAKSHALNQHLDAAE